MSLAAFSLTPFLLVAADGPKELFESSKLENGIRLSVATIAAAQRETFFAFVPVGLATDDAGATQFAHLLEHMLIRSTDPEGLEDAGVVFNGETSDSTLRLDLHAEPKDAPRAAAKLVGWLGAREFDEAVLEREKANIRAEVENTTKGGFAHKWALAAWNQVVRHGAQQASVMGAVDAADVAAVAAYARAKVEPGPALRIYAVGPLDTKAVQALFAASLAQWQGRHALAALVGGDGGEIAAAAPTPAKPSGAGGIGRLAPGELTADWDLPAGHLLEWYLLPPMKVPERTAAAVLLLGQLVMMRLQTDSALAAQGVHALATTNVVVPEGRLLLLSANLPPGVAAATVHAAFRRALDHAFEGVPGVGSLDAWMKIASGEFTRVPDFKAERALWKGKPGVELLEAQRLLAPATFELAAGRTFGELGAAVKGLSAAALVQWAQPLLAPEQGGRLLLGPRR